MTATTTLPSNMTLIQYDIHFVLQVKSATFNYDDYKALYKTLPGELQTRLIGWQRVAPRSV
jgi:hypothetical protein